MKNTGFTLAELITVIAIIVLLVGATVPATRNAKSQAQSARVSADLETIKTASLMLHNDTAHWPPAGTAGNDLIANSDSWTGYNGPYLDQWKNDPWGKPYETFISGSSPVAEYVQSWGPDKASGGTDNLNLIITPDTSK